MSPAAPVPPSSSRVAARRPPRLAGHWLWGSLRARRKDPLGLFMAAGALGPVSSFRMVTVPIYCINHPEAVAHVMVENAGNYWKGYAAQFLRPLLGNGLLLSEGAVWKRQRRLAQPAFHRDALAAMVAGMVDCTDRVLDAWEKHAASGAAFNVLPELMSLTMSVVARALFSTDVTRDAGEVREALDVVLEESNERIIRLNPLRVVLPTAKRRGFRQALRVLDSVVYKIIEGRRQAPDAAPQTDLLGLLMTTADADSGERMSDAQLRDEVMTLFMAGHETTANALCWLFYLVGQHPDVARRMRGEVDDVLQGRAPGVQDLQRLRYCSMVLDETLRLYPPAWLLTRQARAADVVQGMAIPARSVLALSPYVLHRHPDFWERPESFDPERFAPGAAPKRPKDAYCPFGVGQRTCIGNMFALYESLAILARLLQRFELELVPGQVVVPEARVTLRPKDGIRFRLARRE